MYPTGEPYDTGMLDVGDGNRVYWEVSGNPQGKPALIVHGGPGSGASSSPRWRTYFDPEAYRVVLFDQRGCGRSTPSAARWDTDLSVNTTHHLLADMELLRRHLGIERWQLFGGSWGTTLGLAYAVRHPDRVSEVVMSGIGTTTPGEVQWITRDVGRIFPEAWDRFHAAAGRPEGNMAEAYARLLEHPDAAVREQAAADWCDWEDSHVRLRPGQPRDTRYDDRDFRVTFARLVTHYWRHHAWLEDGELLRGVEGLGRVPGVLVHGRLDVSSPLETAWRLSRAWPGCELVVVDDAGHGLGLGAALVAATDAFAHRT
ncbi:prolyl aminopeptidase [Nonomuraea pusilla]|uniref:prolyl aminopeptidase n=1 Tax=Nonomuraea pusilla TaxID=46177 RepID=UPI00331ABF43